MGRPDPKSVAAALAAPVCLALAVLGAFFPGAAMADQLEQCQNRPVAGDEGEAELGVYREARGQMARSGLGTVLSDPARRLGGVPVYPVRSASEDEGRVVAELAGGFLIRNRDGRRVKVVLNRLLREGPDSTRVEGRLDGSRATLFLVRGAMLEKNQATGQVQLTGGRATLSSRFAAALKKRVGMRGARPGMKWGPLYLTWDEKTPPAVTVPPEPGTFTRPAGATELADATILWRVRPSWVQYVASGRPPAAVRGAIAGDPEVIDSQPPLAYEFSFPFSSGWVEDGAGVVESASVKGAGGVYFRYCGSSNIYKGINFIVHSPEFEVDGSSARLIFRVEGTDATPFPDSRAVVVELARVAPLSDGASSTWQALPGSVPAGALGVFAGFYGAGAEFGSVTVTIERGPV